MKERVVCCIDDIHGYFNKLQNLKSNLQALIGPSDFQSFSWAITVTGELILQKVICQFVYLFAIQIPKQTHVFLYGNHELAFTATVEVPTSVVQKTSQETSKCAYKGSISSSDFLKI